MLRKRKQQDKTVIEVDGRRVETPRRLTGEEIATIIRDLRDSPILWETEE